MGLDLYLLPFTHDSEACAFSHTVLRCERDYDFFTAIKRLPKQRVPASFTCYVCSGDRDSHYGTTQHDAYGQQLMCVEAGSLAGLTSSQLDNRPILAYVRALPLGTRIALFWN